MEKIAWIEKYRKKERKSIARLEYFSYFTRIVAIEILEIILYNKNSLFYLTILYKEAGKWMKRSSHYLEAKK